MKKVISAVLAAAILLCGCSITKYKSRNLTSTNDENGWSCSFDSMDGDYSNGFKINSSSLRIESSVESGSMDIVLFGNGETESYDGTNFDEIISVEKFGSDVLYITLKCDNAQNGKIRIVWSADNEETPQDIHFGI